jgi:hypothetical protein
MVGASMAFVLPPRCSFWLSGILDAEVDGARDDSWRGRFTVWLYLEAKPSDVGGDVDGLRYIAVRQGDRAFFHASSFLVTTVGGSTFQGM